jgi:cell division control protein 6
VSLLANIFEAEKKTGRIIKNEDALNFEYVPKQLPHREGQVEEIASSIKPMLGGAKGTNLFITGAPGIGKTASLKWVLRELGEHTDEVIPLYVNCWSNRTKFFIFQDMANHLKLSFTAGKSADHLLQQIEYKLKGKSAIFVFDEIDKVEDNDFLYQILEKFPRSTVFLASNMSDYTINMDPRIKSRLTIRTISFKPYSLLEVTDILRSRVKLSLKEDSIDPSLLKQIANITYNKGDLRVGLFMLREAARNAENNQHKAITEADIKPIISQLENTKIGEEEKLNSDEKKIIESIKEHNGGVAGAVYDSYKKKGGELSYRSFKRYVTRLETLGLTKTEETGAGFKGKSTKISLN